MTTAIATTDRAPTTPRAATAAPKKDPATGKWGFVCDVVSPDGRRHQTRRKGFATKAEAQAALDRVRTSVRSNSYVASLPRASGCPPFAPT